MMTDETKKKLLARLRRAEGQLSAVRRMIEDDAYCVDVMTQIAAVQGALSRSGSILLGSHIEHCVTDTFERGDPLERQARIEELLDLFARYGGPRP